MKFTQEIKDKWLKALKSGKYKQGFYTLHRISDNSYCCLGVLMEVCPKVYDPYEYLDNNMDYMKVRDLYRNNDKDSKTENYPRDYSNVIPLIEELPVQIKKTKI